LENKEKELKNKTNLHNKDRSNDLVNFLKRIIEKYQNKIISLENKEKELKNKTNLHNKDRSNDLVNFLRRRIEEFQNKQREANV